MREDSQGRAFCARRVGAVGAKRKSLARASRAPYTLCGKNGSEFYSGAGSLGLLAFLALARSFCSIWCFIMSPIFFTMGLER
jgi:hypothetical protein